jgi:threonine dehydratase
LQGVRTLEESVSNARRLAAEGRYFVHPYDDWGVIAGQGTIGLEILDDLPDPDLVLVPLGGGGLIAGTALAIRDRRPSCRLIGVQAAACPSAFMALEARAQVMVRAGPTLADGIRVSEIGTLTFPVIQDLVECVVLVGEEEIADAMLSLLERKRVVAEGAGAAPLAALLSGIPGLSPRSKVVLVVSGGNVDSPQLSRIIRQTLMRRGRILKIQVVLKDHPGTLATLLAMIAHSGGNVLHVHNAHAECDLPLHEVGVSLEVETRGPAHNQGILSAIQASGLSLRDP